MATTLLTLQADWQQNYAQYLDVYQSGQSSFIPNLLPQTAVQFTVYQTLDILHKRLGNELLRQALDPTATVESPATWRTDGSWIKRSNMVGINVRTIGSFWNVINYVLTLPASHDCIHLLPIWEPGVVGSLYGMVSWQINPEFFSTDLAQAIPTLDTVEKQLKVVTNLIHALGRTVGMDVIPHTDRFSEMVFAHPAFFEWVQRSQESNPPIRILNQSEFVYKQVEGAIWQFLQLNGTADKSLLSIPQEVFFAPESELISDSQRHLLLFGPPTDYQGRLTRRLQLIRHLVQLGYETVPMTMAPPYRGLHINPDVFVVDDYGQRWYQYDFDQPQAMSRVFGPLTRYKFHHSQDDNQRWELDFGRPNVSAWNYVCRQYYACQQAYNFDFMRGDMAHVQMQPTGVPATVDAYYDPLRTIKHYVQEQGVQHFGFFAETFLAEPNVMGYGDELDHLEAIDADSTLGDLQAAVVGSAEFIERFNNYYHWLKTRRFTPSFTVITADKDDPRFDEFYRTGNLFRYFVALFLTDMPSYIGLGFEVRNLHEQRGVNEEYSKLYVFRIEDDEQPDKVTHGPFIWGKNAAQFAIFTRMRLFAERVWPEIQGKETRWLIPPGENGVVAWTHTHQPAYCFAASMSGPLPTQLEGLPVAEIVFDEGSCRIWRSKPN